MSWSFFTITYDFYPLILLISSTFFFLNAHSSVWLGQYIYARQTKPNYMRAGENKNSKLYQALADTIMRANWQELKEERKMCEALRELFADDLRESREEGIMEGRNVGKREGKLEGKREGEA